MSVYFIRNSESGAVKIGTTSGDPRKRLSALQTANHAKLELLYVTGEWFDGTTAVYDALREIRDHDEASEKWEREHECQDDSCAAECGGAKARQYEARCDRFDADLRRGHRCRRIPAQDCRCPPLMRRQPCEVRFPEQPDQTLPDMIAEVLRRIRTPAPMPGQQRLWDGLSP